MLYLASSSIASSVIKLWLLLTHNYGFVTSCVKSVNFFETNSYKKEFQFTYGIHIMVFFFKFLMGGTKHFLVHEYFHPGGLLDTNVKRVKWLLFNRVKSVRNTLTEWKWLSKRVKIIPKWVTITPKRVKITPIEWISLLGEAHRGTALLFRAVPLCAPP